MRTAVQHKTGPDSSLLVTRQPASQAGLLAEATAWEQGAREEFDALIAFVRADAKAPGAEGAVMARLAVVGAALIRCLGARRDVGSRRRRRSGRTA